MCGRIQRGRLEHIGEWVIVSVDKEWWRIVEIKIVENSKDRDSPLTYGPLEGKKLNFPE